MHEAAIRTRVGGRAVMREQLGRVIELAQLPMVSVQVLPFESGAHAAMGTAFTTMRLPEPRGTRVVYLEDLWSADYLTRQNQIDAYNSVFDRLSAAALSAENSATALREAAGELA